jgi:carboxylesterase type B
MSDYIFKCPTSNLASAYRNAGVASYVYSMEHVPGWSALKGSCYGVSHTDEIPFVFPSTLPLLAGLYQFTPQEQNLSMNMMISWAHFATTKNPSNSLAPWVSWNDEMQYTVLNLNITAATQFRSKYCEFWNGTYKPAGPLHWGIWIIIGVGSAAVLAAAGYLIWRYVRYRNQYTRLSS